MWKEKRTMLSDLSLFLSYQYKIVLKKQVAINNGATSPAPK